MKKKQSKIVPKEKIPLLEGNKVTSYEKELPYPYVYYPPLFSGAFIGFQETKESPTFFCSCQRIGIEKYMEFNDYVLRPTMPSHISRFSSNKMKYADNLCHICNHTPPQYAYASKSSMMTRFRCIYGYYIEGIAYEYGVEGHFSKSIFAPDLLPEELLPFLKPIHKSNRKFDEQTADIFRKHCENLIRLKIGYFEIGKKWKTEAKLLELVRKIYPNYTILHQYPLSHLRADIYIEELKLVIEYQGEQHFKPIQAWGGIEQFKKIQERDVEKVDLCAIRRIKIIYFTYQDDLNENLVRNRISKLL